MPKRAATDNNLADRITRDVQSGMYGPGAWLKQIDLQERYEATRLDVRRALDQLASKRVIQHVPNRGYMAHDTNPQMRRDVAEIRAMLEVGAVDSLLPNVTDAKVRELRALAKKFAGMLDDGTLMEQYEINLAFHSTLYAMCSNRELVVLIEEMRGRQPSAPSGEWRRRSRVEKSAREHEAIVDALEARDAKRMKKLIYHHIIQGEN